MANLSCGVSFLLKPQVALRVLLALSLVAFISYPTQAQAAAKACLPQVSDAVFDYGVGGTLITGANWQETKLGDTRGIEKVEQLDGSFLPNSIDAMTATAGYKGALPYVPYPVVNKAKLSALLAKAGSGLTTSETLNFQGGFDLPSLQSSQKFLAEIATLTPVKVEWKQTYNPPPSSAVQSGYFVISGTQYHGTLDVKTGSSLPATWSEKLLLSNTKISTVPNQKVSLTLTVSGKNCLAMTISSRQVGVTSSGGEAVDSGTTKDWMRGSALGTANSCPPLKYFAFSGYAADGSKKDYVQYQFDSSTKSDISCGSLATQLRDPAASSLPQGFTESVQSLVSAAQTFTAWLPDAHQSGTSVISLPTMFKSIAYLYKDVNQQKPQLHLDWSNCPVTPVAVGAIDAKVVIKNAGDSNYALKLNNASAFECAVPVWFSAKAVTALAGIKTFKFNQSSKSVPSTTKSTITCVNGAQTRQLTAINPDCSFLGEGWRKK